MLSDPSTSSVISRHAEDQPKGSIIPFTSGGLFKARGKLCRDWPNTGIVNTGFENLEKSTLL
ncbi:hypothetical protein RYX36_007620, partial [Vicia faba]